MGAVLSHRFSADSERPIAYASRTMAPVEKRYSQLNKEALAIIFGLKRFHQYLYGRKFIKTSGSKSRPKKVELASAHEKRDNYCEYLTHNNEACKNPYKTTLPH